MMRVALLTSDHPRHRYFAATMAEALPVVCLVSESKGADYRPASAPEGPIARHFADIDVAERRYFGEAELPAVPRLRVERGGVNAVDAFAWVAERRPDYLLLFGTGILASHWLQAYPRRVINLHLGLAPYYRGSATLFWPLAEGRLECVGCTIHLATERVDAGGVLAQTKPVLEPGDDYYDITTKAMRAGIAALPGTVAAYHDGRLRPRSQPAGGGRAYRKVDFDEAQLRRALTWVGDGLSREQIDAARRSERCPCLQ